MRDYLSGLNERQKEAVLHTEGPLMIVAGAGSGKTKVLTTRIAHLMAQGVDAFHILALTFTNKAAKEMKERIEHILDNREARNLYIGTFHSVFARILRKEGHRLILFTTGSHPPRMHWWVPMNTGMIFISSRKICGATDRRLRISMMPITNAVLRTGPWILMTCFTRCTVC
jgi:superfamily I DNA/RNA helicase